MGAQIITSIWLFSIKRQDTPELSYGWENPLRKKFFGRNET